MTSNIIKQKLVRSKGINDYSGQVSEIVNEKKKSKPFYDAWHSMLNRCYSEKRHQGYPTYIGCTVCDEWLGLANFKAWHNDNYIEGYHLDKDIIKKGNKIYSPEYCRYISPQLNNLLGNSASTRGDFPQGVSFEKRSKINPYLARVNYNGKRNHIGNFPTVKTAYMAYANAKHKIIIEVARKQTDIALREGLVNHAMALMNKANSYNP